MDLPGRGRAPGNLDSATRDDFVEAVIQSIEDRGLDEIILVGHSLAGATIPEVAIRLGSRRVKRLVFVATLLPPNGTSPMDSLGCTLRAVARWAARRSPTIAPIHPMIASYAFCNGMTAAQRSFSLSDVRAESLTLVTTPVDRSALSAEIPRTWVLTRRDRTLAPTKQRRFIADLGYVDDVIEIDACHNVMISHPEQLAAALLQYV